MALALSRDITDIELVVDACVSSYARADLPVEAGSWNRLVLDTDIRQLASLRMIRSGDTIECVLGSDIDPIEHRSALAAVTSETDHIVVLIHVARLGEAHRALRGLRLRLQGWWIESGIVRFGRPEIP